MSLDEKWNDYLRRTAKGQPRDSELRSPVNKRKTSMVPDATLPSVDIKNPQRLDTTKRQSTPSPKLDASGERDRRKSPSPSIKRGSSQPRDESPSKRHRSKDNNDNDDDFKRPPQNTHRQLWEPGQGHPSPPPGQQNKIHQAGGDMRRAGPDYTRAQRASDNLPADDSHIKMIKQPDTRAISQEQLVAEVKGIYAGLVMVESKCIEVVNNQTSVGDGAAKLNKDQWHALIALHRTLLHEHHDFFLASQHPSASPALRRLAAKYAMPARMWRHGIHSFLELLRHNLPGSYEHMITFIYMAYSMMALLLETVPAFEETWIECLGDLGRYRMAIEDEDIRDREHWASVSRHWYSLASDKSPTTGRLYHHLGILARPNAVLQLFYYTKSLCVEIPFASARESIMTLFDPIMSLTPNPQQSRLSVVELYFVKAHAILFSRKHMEQLLAVIDVFLQNLDGHIARLSRRFIEASYQIALANICALCGYGDEANPLVRAIMAHSRPSLPPSTPPGTAASDSTKPGPPASELHPEAIRLFTGTCEVIFRRFADSNILPFLHVTLVFMYHLISCPDGIALLAPHFPWKLIATMLNTLISGAPAASSTQPGMSHGPGLVKVVEMEGFPGSLHAAKGSEAEQKGPGSGTHKKRPLPDDYAMRGFPWVEGTLPKDWFDTDERIDDDDKFFELPSMIEERRERVIWVGGRIVAVGRGKWLQFDKTTGRFGVSAEYDVDLEISQAPATPVESAE